jgi:hypothetical protein
MKQIPFAAGLLILFFGCKTNSPSTEEFIRADVFLNPPAEYRSAPFYSLNDRLDTAELVKQIHAFRDAGYGGFFLHSRTGLLTEYLGKEWWEAMDASVRAAKQTGLKAWFYDEDKWPSGFAGGKVPLASDKFHARCLVRMDKKARVAEPDTSYFENGQFKYVCHKSAMGDPWFNGTTWVDLLNPETVKTFIEFSYKPYLDRYKDEMGKTAPGIFTDEPQVSPRPWGTYPSIPFSPVIPAVFKKMHGYDLIPNIPSLFDTVGNFRKIRYDYYQTISRCFEESFAKQIGEVNEKANSVFTGHINGEENFSSVMRNVGNAMITYRHMQMPGIDELGLNYGLLNSPKSVSSVANQYGIPRRLSEAYGISGQNMNFEDRKWLLDWHTINGINFICPHLSLYSMKGERKRDYPPDFSPAQPYWTFNKLFEDYTGRMCYVTTIGKYAADILVMHPLESEYFGIPNDCYAQYDRCLNDLQKIHRNYDLGDEQIIADTAMIEQGNFVIGEMRYKVVVLPEMLVIRRTTLDLLKQFKAAGGVILKLGMYPACVDGNPDAVAIDSLRKITRFVEENKLKEVLEEVLPSFFKVEGTDNELVWTHHRKVNNGGIIQMSNTSRLKSIECDLIFTASVKNPALWNPENGTSMKLQPGDDGRIRLHFDPATTWLITYGEASREAGSDNTYKVPADKTKLEEIGGAWQGNRADPNSLILDFARYSTDNGRTFSRPEPVIGIHQRLTAKKYTGNLILKYEVEVADVPRKYSLVVEQPYLYRILVNGKKINFVGRDYYRDQALRTQDISGTLKEGVNDIVLSLNYVAPEPASLDAVKRYGTEIESIYLTGDFAVSVTPSAEPLAESQKNSLHLFPERPLHSISHFVVTREKDLFEGDLVEQGYPFYAGTFILKNSFAIDKKQHGKEKRYFISLPSFEAIVVKVRVNDREFDPLLYSPWEIDITGAVQEGNNQVEIELTNSLRNLLGPHHHTGGELTAVGPVTFTGNPGWPSNTGGETNWYDIRLSGKSRLWKDDYYLIPFGLLEPPVILKN